MKVRRAEASDAERCEEISPMRSAQQLRELHSQSDVVWLVIEDGSGTVVGQGIIDFWAWNKMAWVWDLTIDPEERGKGLGRALLEGMIQAAREIGARVLMDFEPATRTALADLYARNGFRVCGTNDRWFGSDKDGLAVFYGFDL